MTRGQGFPNLDTPRHLISYEHNPPHSSPGSSNNVSPADTNCSLNSSTTNTSSTCSTTRHLNKKNLTNTHELISSISKSSNPFEYEPEGSNSTKPNPIQLNQSDESEDFLPICDALFNVICLVAYFCDIVFDVLTAYSFYQQGLIEWSITAMIFVTLSMILSQAVSFQWYRKGSESSDDRDREPPPCSTGVLILLHFSLCGVLWRYFKLFIPVDLRYVKSEVRDLCLLRLIHAFTEAGPMLIIQLYLIFLKSSPDQVTELTIVSTTLSLFTLCWALSSFSKNVRRQNVHKLVLTWLGVIFQFLWRLGTVTARVLVLSVYTTAYHNWIFLVIILHWFSMLMWLISPKNIFHGEKMSSVKKIGYSALIAIVYILCYINVQEVNSRQKVIIFYVTMFLENSLLLSVWFIAVRHEGFWYKNLVISGVFLTFILGILFMILYYKFFHIKKLNYDYEDGVTVSPKGSSTVNNNTSGCDYYSSISVNQFEEISSSSYNRNYNNQKKNSSSTSKNEEFLHNESHSTSFGNLCISSPQAKEKSRPKQPFYNKINGHHIHHPNVPGVFNCRFNPAIKRKKKKPTSFVPPPLVGDIISNTVPRIPLEEHQNATEFVNLSPMSSSHPLSSMSLTSVVVNQKKMTNPFWKRPLSITVGSENEGSIISSRADIHRKLQEKKQKQLEDLRQIEEEIKEGKLCKPDEMSLYGRNGVEPIPISKKQPWFRGDQGMINGKRPPILIPLSDELILDPQYLLFHHHNSDGHQSPPGFYDRSEWLNFYEPINFQNEGDGVEFSDIDEDDDVMGESISDMMNEQRPEQKQHYVGESRTRRRKHQTNSNSKDGIYKSYRIPSDVDSQVSIPRSYTLPRKFKYERKFRKTIKTEHFLPSNNSSDGDVDSGEEETGSYTRPYPLPYPSVHRVVRNFNISGQQKRWSGSRKKIRQPETPL